jgi:hypothetical protein
LAGRGFSVSVVIATPLLSRGTESVDLREHRVGIEEVTPDRSTAAAGRRRAGPRYGDGGSRFRVHELSFCRVYVCRHPSIGQT